MRAFAVFNLSLDLDGVDGVDGRFGKTKNCENVNISEFNTPFYFDANKTVCNSRCTILNMFVIVTKSKYK